MPTPPSTSVPVALALVVALTGCGGGVVEEAPPEPVGAQAPSASELLPLLGDGDGVRLIDLTHELSPESLYWPSGSPFEHDGTAGINDDGYWYASASFSTPEHLGTHLDAPIHFGEGGWTSAAIPLDRLVSPGVVIDIAERAAADADATLAPADIAAWEATHGTIPAAAVVIVRTGWASRWPDWNDYYGSDTPMDVATLHFPGVSEAAAEALVERGIAGLGIDTASIDPGISTMFDAHRVLAPANIYNLENLTNVDTLPPTGFVVIAMPPKIADGTGGPTRVVAVVPEA